ncbi:MAG: YncE family protein, partial [Actinobacteria bacterium]|nr:YncE family protein [Actinomycetota bacterium]
AVSSRDRVYTADQISNTISVIDPRANALLGVIRLGDPFTAALSPLYKGALLVHGLGFSPDHRTLAVVAIGSNSVILIDTARNTVKGTVYVGRSPHEAFFTPDGRELWVAVRGEDYIAVIDPAALKETRRIQVANGPGMVLFRPDGRYAFVPSSFTAELAVIDTKTYRVVARVKQASPFSPNLAVSPDGAEVWFTLKDVGKTQVIRADPPFDTLSTLDIGPVTNHVALVDNARGQFAYLTVGGLNEVQVWRRGRTPTLMTRIPTGDLPHGLWASEDGSRVYINLENGDAVQAIDTLTNAVVATIPVGQLPQALVYVPNAVPAGPGTENLVPLGESGIAAHLALVAAEGANPSARGNVVVNSLGQLDHLQIVATGLEPGREYQLSIVTSRTAPFGERTYLTKGKANPAGALLAQALGPIRAVVGPDGNAKSARAGQRFLLLTATDNDHPILVQKNP